MSSRRVRKITVDGTKEGMEQAARWLERYSRIMLDKANGLIDKMLREGEDYAVNELGHIDTGETVSTILGYREGNHGVLLVGGNAIWIEFGTGVFFNGEGYNHPKAEELGMDAHGTYGYGFGSNPNGWYYIGDDGESHHTQGIEANMFFYRTAQRLRPEYARWAKEIFAK